jgi:hypothetical protein
MLGLLGLAYAARNLEFVTDRSSLVGENRHYHRNYLEFRKEFPGQDALAVLVESENREKNRQFVERLGARLEAEPELFADVFYRNDFKMLGTNALLFADDGTIEQVRQALEQAQPFVTKLAQATNLVSLFDLVNRQFLAAGRAEASGPAGRSPDPTTEAETDAMLEALPALERILQQAGDSLRRSGLPPSPGINALFGDADEAERQIYVTTAGSRMYLISAHAVSDELTRQALQRLRELVRVTEAEVPGVNVGVIGEPVLEHDEMLQSQKDTSLATLVALALTGMLFIYGYQETGRPLKGVLCLVVGLGQTMGFVTLAVGHLNVLTIAFAPMLVGLAIDFSIHLVARYEEELRVGRSKRLAMDRALVATGQGILTGCFTTAAAFLAMGLTGFRAVREIGVIAGGGLLICLVPMMTMLPALLLRGRQNILDSDAVRRPSRRLRVERWWLDYPAAVCGIALGISLAAGHAGRRIYFDYNLLNMQSKGLPAVVYTLKYIEAGSNSVLYAAVVTDTPERARQLESHLTHLPTVASVKSMARYLGDAPPEKLALIGSIRRLAGNVRLPPVDLDPVSVSDLDRSLFSFSGYLAAAMSEVEKRGEGSLLETLTGLRKTVVDLRQRLAHGNPAATSVMLGAFQRALFLDIRDTFRTLREQNDQHGMRAADLPAALRNRFIGRSGKHLLQVYPRENVWRRDHQERFVQDLRRVVPEVTGTPVQLYEYTTLLKNSYTEAAGYALAAIVVLLLVHFGSAVAVLLALLPVGLGFVWTVGIMVWTQVPFNPANVMTLPLVVGIGVTNGVQILNRFAEEHNPSVLGKSTGKAVLLSGLTTIAGFGSLMLAEHQGIQSLGFVMSVGTAACMIAGLTVLPACVKLLIGAGWQAKKQPSGDNAQSTLGREEPRSRPRSTA